MPMDDRDKDTSEDFLRTFLKRNLGYLDARIVEIQHLHRIDECKDGKPWQILPRLLSSKIVNKFSYWATD